MSTTAVALIVVGAVALAHRTPWLPNELATLGPIGLAWWPMPAALVLAAMLVWRKINGLIEQRRRHQLAEDDVIVLGDLSLLGLSAGLGLGESLRLASESLSATVEAEVDAALRRSRLVGLSGSLAAASGHCARLFQLSARAVATGAPVSGAIDAFVDDATSRQRERSLTAARRMPVKLLFPLTLLILPGFMVLTVGPALLGSLQRLST